MRLVLLIECKLVEPWVSGALFLGLRFFDLNELVDIVTSLEQIVYTALLSPAAKVLDCVAIEVPQAPIMDHIPGLKLVALIVVALNLNIIRAQNRASPASVACA